MEKRSENIIWTIGHSTRPIEEFIHLLRSFKIEILADIRRYPGSKKYPHFNQSNLQAALKKEGIGYVSIPELGGRRKPKPDSLNTAWRNAAFQGYADYMESEEFKNAVNQLEELGRKNNVAYMCSEAVWWRCHRALVSDYLKVRGWKVMHIMSEGKATEHPFTKPAKEVQGKLFYD